MEKDISEITSNTITGTKDFDRVAAVSLWELVKCASWAMLVPSKAVVTATYGYNEHNLPYALDVLQGLEQLHNHAKAPTNRMIKQYQQHLRLKSTCGIDVYMKQATNQEKAFIQIWDAYCKQVDDCQKASAQIRKVSLQSNMFGFRKKQKVHYYASIVLTIEKYNQMTFLLGDMGDTILSALPKTHPLVPEVQNVVNRFLEISSSPGKYYVPHIKKVLGS